MDNEPNKSWRPFTDMYERWDKPSFHPEDYQIRPSKDSSNRSVRARVWESITGTLRNGRIQLLEHLSGGSDTPKGPVP